MTQTLEKTFGSRPQTACQDHLMPVAQVSPSLSPVFQQDGSSGIATHSAAAGGRAGGAGGGRGGAGEGAGRGGGGPGRGGPGRGRAGEGAGPGRAGGGPGAAGAAGGGPGAGRGGPGGRGPDWARPTPPAGSLDSGLPPGPSSCLGSDVAAPAAPCPSKSHLLQGVMKHRRWMYRGWRGPPRRPGSGGPLRSRANTPAPRPPPHPDPQHLPQPRGRFAERIRARNGHDAPTGLSGSLPVSIRSTFPFWWVGASRTLSSRSGQSHALQISPRGTGLCSVHRVFWEPAALYINAVDVSHSHSALSGLVLTPFFP